MNRWFLLKVKVLPLVLTFQSKTGRKRPWETMVLVPFVTSSLLTTNLTYSVRKHLTEHAINADESSRSHKQETKKFVLPNRRKIWPYHGCTGCYFLLKFNFSLHFVGKFFTAN